MRRLRRLGAAFLTPVVMTGVASFSSAASAQSLPGVITSLAPAVNGSRTTLFATLARSGCRSDCAQLLRSNDGGARWQRVRSRGWQAGAIRAVVAREGRPLLVSGATHVQISNDLGATFQNVAAAGAPTDAVAVDGSVRVLAVRGDVVSLVESPSGAITRVRTTLATPVANFVPAAFGEPGIFVAGADRRTHRVSVQLCDARGACEAARALSSPEDTGRPFVSPFFTQDHTILVAGVRGAFFRSADGGATFVPATIVATNGLISTVQTISFARAGAGGTGTVLYAGVLGATTTKSGATLTGGLYRSDDRGATWRLLDVTGGGSGVTALTRSKQTMWGSFLAMAPGPTTRVVCLPDAGTPSRCAGAAAAGASGGTHSAPAPRAGIDEKQTPVKPATQLLAEHYSKRGAPPEPLMARAWWNTIALGLFASTAGALLAAIRRRRSSPH